MSRKYRINIMISVLLHITMIVEIVKKAIACYHKSGFRDCCCFLIINSLLHFHSIETTFSIIVSATARYILTIA